MRNILKTLPLICTLLLLPAMAVAGTVFNIGNASVTIAGTGWEIHHGTTVVAHGDGKFDMDNLPPAVAEFIKYYSELPLTVSQPQMVMTRSGEVYEPLISTQWNQEEPYNRECPTVNGQRVPVGCSTISSAQVLNYYRYCLPMDLQGVNESYAELESPYFYGQKKELNVYKYSFSYKCEPDFDRMETDADELARFLFAVALAQKAYFDVDGSMTSPFVQRGAFETIFGYDYNIYDKGFSSNDLLPALQAGHPLIMSGDNDVAGHSFIIDGWNGREFHFNYGWGGMSDGWYLYDDNFFPNNQTALEVWPSDGTRPKMQKIPENVHIIGLDNDFECTVKMEPCWEGSEDYIPGLISLQKGSYAMWIEYPDGSVIAPVLKDNNPMSKMNSRLISYGLYQTTPAQFSVSVECYINVWHSPTLGHISIQGQNFRDPDYCNYNMELVFDGKTIQTTFDSSSQKYYVQLECAPGEHEFLFHSIKFDANVGKAEACGPEPIVVKYGGLYEIYNVYGWASAFCDTPFNIVLDKVGNVNDESPQPIAKWRLNICLDEYCEANLSVLNVEAEGQPAIPEKPEVLYVIDWGTGNPARASALLTLRDDSCYEGDVVVSDIGESYGYFCIGKVLDSNWLVFNANRLGGPSQNYVLSSGVQAPLVYGREAGYRVQAGTYHVVVDLESGTISIDSIHNEEPVPSFDEEECLYVLGCDGMWIPAMPSALLTLRSDGCYGGDITVTDAGGGYGYFCLGTEKSEDWGVFNANRLGAPESDYLLAGGTVCRYILGKDASFKAQAGTHHIVVDLESGTISFDCPDKVEPVLSLDEETFIDLSGRPVQRPMGGQTVISGGHKYIYISE